MLLQAEPSTFCGLGEIRSGGGLVLGKEQGWRSLLVLGVWLDWTWWWLEGCGAVGQWLATLHCKSVTFFQLGRMEASHAKVGQGMDSQGPLDGGWLAGVEIVGPGGSGAVESCRLAR